MKHSPCSTLALLSVFMLPGIATGQATGGVTPNNPAVGDQITIELKGLPANTRITVTFAIVEGAGAYPPREVTTNDKGRASWTETCKGPAGTYATNASWRIGSGQPANTTTGNVTVQ